MMKDDFFKKPEEEKVDISAKVEVKPEEKIVDPEEKIVDPEEKILAKAIKETAKVENSKQYVVTCTRLNVRKGASDRDDILRTIASGDEITVDVSKSRGAWSKITAPCEGYVLTKFIAPVK